MLHYNFFHHSSKKIPKLGNENTWPDAWKRTDYKAYNGAKRYALEVDQLRQLSTSVQELFTDRETYRDFKKNSPPSLATIGSLLKYGCGDTDDFINDHCKQKRRTYPSAGALYPIEVYPLLRKTSSDISAGLYHYRPDIHELELLDDKYDRDVVNKLLYYEWSKHAPILLFITGTLGKLVNKYADRGYRFMLQESGIVARTIEFSANALDLNVGYIGGTDDLEIERFLDIDGVNESHLLTIAIG